jgi:diguanylate cyclase (GGDEF)-like protein
MRLNRLFMLTTGVLLTLVSIMLAQFVLRDWQAVTSATTGLEAMNLTYQAIKVAELASFERGPTNAVLGDSEPPVPSKRQRMAVARAASDGAIDAALASLAGSSKSAHIAASAQMASAREELIWARKEVDRVAALPLERRMADAGRVTSAPIELMFRVIDTTLEGVTLLSVDAERADPALSLPLAGARLAAELREYAGRVGSKFTAALTARAPLGEQARRDIAILLGRIEQLHRMIALQVRANREANEIAEAFATMESHYFSVGLPFIETMSGIGLTTGDYEMDTAQFAAIYVKEMTSIVALRDVLFSVAREGAQRSHAQATSNLTFHAALGGVVLMIEMSVFLLVRHRVLKPLLRYTRAVVAIADGKLDTPLPSATRSDEIGDMQNAVLALKKTSQAKRQLEVEREQLVEQLRQASSVDYLTGILNRREFVARAQQQLAASRRRDWSVALIVFDIDHFKSINDRFGHVVGDLALVQIAALAQQEFRTTDTLARYGGEEFVVLVADCDVESARMLADRLKESIAKAVFKTLDHERYSVTASFGLAAAPARDVSDIDTLFQSADQALYIAKAQGRNQVCVFDGTT